MHLFFPEIERDTSCCHCLRLRPVLSLQQPFHRLQIQFRSCLAVPSGRPSPMLTYGIEETPSVARYLHHLASDAVLQAFLCICFLRPFQDRLFNDRLAFWRWIPLDCWLGCAVRSSGSFSCAGTRIAVHCMHSTISPLPRDAPGPVTMYCERRPHTPPRLSTAGYDTQIQHDTDLPPTLGSLSATMLLDAHATCLPPLLDPPSSGQPFSQGTQCLQAEHTTAEIEAKRQIHTACTATHQSTPDGKEPTADYPPTRKAMFPVRVHLPMAQRGASTATHAAHFGAARGQNCYTSLCSLSAAANFALHQPLLLFAAAPFVFPCRPCASCVCVAVSDSVCKSCSARATGHTSSAFLLSTSTFAPSPHLLEGQTASATGQRERKRARATEQTQRTKASKRPG